jgi:hypothetical protein
MKPIEQIGYTIGRWIDQEELPVRANLKVIRKSDPDYGLSDDEIMDRNEFVRCYLLQDCELLLMIPKQDGEDDFFIKDYQESAFNTFDYHRLHPSRSFNKYAYRIRKIMEQGMDLAIMHSCISSEEGRQNVQRRYQILVNAEFRYPALRQVERFRNCSDREKRYQLKKKIGHYNTMILKCNEIWRAHSPPG